MLSQVTNMYLDPSKALNDSQQKKFQEDYKKWYLETQIGVEFPLGDPQPKTQQEQPAEMSPEMQEETAATLMQ